MNRLLNADWTFIPEHMREGLRSYIEYGVLPGSFLQAVLRNDLTQACMFADDINQNRLHHYVKFLRTYAPDACWGTGRLVQDWAKQGGLSGLRRAS